MKKIILILGSLLFSIHTFAQSSIWTEDFEGAWVKALNEGKQVLVYFYEDDMCEEYKSEIFENYAKDKFYCVNVPTSYDKRSKKFGRVHARLRAEISPFISIAIFDPENNKKVGFAYWGSAERLVEDLEKSRLALLGKHVAIEQYKFTDITELNITNGFTNKGNAALKYASEKNLWILVMSEDIAKNFTFKNDKFVQENCILIKCKTNEYSGNPSGVFLYTSDSEKYIPLQISKNFISNLKAAMEELRDPEYPKYSETLRTAVGSDSAVYTDFDAAVTVAKSKKKLIYIRISHRLEKINGQEKWVKSFTEKFGFLFIPIGFNSMSTDGDGHCYFRFTADKRHSQILHRIMPNRYPYNILYDPVSRKYCEAYYWDENTEVHGGKTASDRMEASISEFKNPYSSETESMWAAPNSRYWTYDFENAMLEAKKSGKLVFLIFSSATHEYYEGKRACWTLDAKAEYEKAGVICVLIPLSKNAPPIVRPGKPQYLYGDFPRIFKVGDGVYGRLYDPQTERTVPIQTRADIVENMLKLIEEGKAELANPDSKLAFKIEGLPTNKGVK